RSADFETLFAKARASGTPTSVIVGSALRQAAQLHRARLAMEAGGSAAEASASMSPPVHFRRKAAVEAALNTWTSARLERTMGQLSEGGLQTPGRPKLRGANGRSRP